MNYAETLKSTTSHSFLRKELLYFYILTYWVIFVKVFRTEHINKYVLDYFRIKAESVGIKTLWFVNFMLYKVYYGFVRLVKVFVDREASVVSREWTLSRLILARWLFGKGFTLWSLREWKGQVEGETAINRNVRLWSEARFVVGTLTRSWTSRQDLSIGGCHIKNLHLFISSSID